MKKTIYLITITILALGLTACKNNTKSLTCTSRFTDEPNYKTIDTKVTTIFDKDEKKVIKMTYEIETNLDKNHYDDDAAKGYEEAYRADNVCENIKKKLVTPSDKSFKCQDDYQNHKIVTTYTYDFKYLNIEDKEILLFETNSMAELKEVFNHLNYTCK